MESSKLIKLRVRKGKPQLIAPARATPRELKPLSDLDDQQSLRYFQTGIMFYNKAKPTAGSGLADPAVVIKSAVAEALVYYYPWAGRLREAAGGPGGKLMVDCTAEGVVFVEADADDVTIQEFGDESFQPPFPSFEQLHYKCDSIVDCPMLALQVTRLVCGGFILTASHNHVMSDGPGLVQFLTAVAEISRGATSPSVLPVWERQLLKSRDPPRVTHTHPEYDPSPPDESLTRDPTLVHRSFFFGPSEHAALRRLHLQSDTSDFDLLAACVWRCRTVALGFRPDELVRFSIAVNARRKLNPPLPAGYYGNACAFPAAVSLAGEITAGHSITRAVGLVQKAKESVTDELVRSVADLMAVSGRPKFNMSKENFQVSDVSRIEFSGLDFGWGKPSYAGPAHNGGNPTFVNYFVGFRNDKGEDGKKVFVCLPALAMDKFVQELETLLAKA